MKKFSLFLLTILLSILVAGLYGILHDQVTYTICPEYYTKFKFIQFGLADETTALLQPSPRQLVAIIGFLATWWTGIFIGIGLGLTALIFKEATAMFRAIVWPSGG
ncbi:MAG TPA: hypothetical protein VNS58_09015 [Puia sp.]|nr:hypothetical protein [Puia sp.]